MFVADDQDELFITFCRDRHDSTSGRTGKRDIVEVRLRVDLRAGSEGIDDVKSGRRVGEGVRDERELASLELEC